MRKLRLQDSMFSSRGHGANAFNMTTNQTHPVVQRIKDLMELNPQIGNSKNCLNESKHSNLRCLNCGKLGHERFDYPE